MPIGSGPPGESRELSTEPGETAAIDHAHLARYTAGDAALERELLSMFADQSAVYMTRLRGAKTVEAWQDAAHSLKGSAKAVGAFRVAAAAKAAEAAPPQCPREERERLVARLETLLQDAKEQIRRMRRKR